MTAGVYERHCWLRHEALLEECDRFADWCQARGIDRPTAADAARYDAEREDETLRRLLAAGGCDE